MKARTRKQGGDWLIIVTTALAFAAALMTREAGRWLVGAEWMLVTIPALVIGAWLVFCRWTWKVLIGSRDRPVESRRWTSIGALAWLISVTGARFALFKIRGTATIDAAIDSILLFLIGFPIAFWVIHWMLPLFVSRRDSASGR